MHWNVVDPLSTLSADEKFSGEGVRWEEWEWLWCQYSLLSWQLGWPPNLYGDDFARWGHLRGAAAKGSQRDKAFLIATGASVRAAQKILCPCERTKLEGAMCESGRRLAWVPNLPAFWSWILHLEQWEINVSIVSFPIHDILWPKCKQTKPVVKC